MMIRHAGTGAGKARGGRVSRAACNHQAAEKKLTGAAQNSFVKKRVTDATPNVQTTCESVADNKKLSGAARTGVQVRERHAEVSRPESMAQAAVSVPRKRQVCS